MQRWLKILPPLAVIVVAVASFALSYVALRDVSADVGAVPAAMAWLVPIVIDGGTIGGSAVIWAQASDGGRRRVFPFLFVAALVAVSVVVNVNHAAAAPLAKAIAALPPLVLLGSLELAAGQLKRARELDAARAADRDAAEQDEQARAEAEQVLRDRAAAAEADTARLQAQLDTREAEFDAELAAMSERHDRDPDAGARRDAQPAGQPAAADETPGTGDTATNDDAPDTGDVAAAAAVPTTRPAADRTGRASAARPRTAATGPSAVNGHRHPAAAGSAQPASAPARSSAPAAGSPLLQAALDATDRDADTPVREAVEQVFDRFVDLGGDPMERTLTADLALALDSSPGYVRNILRDRRAAMA